MEKKVLLVDRAIVMRKMIADALEKGGYKVVGECDSIAKAIQLTAELSPDLVLTDYLLRETETNHGVSGVTMTKDLLQRFPGITVVICTSTTLYPPQLEEARKAGVKAILQKVDLTSPSRSKQGFAELEKALNA